MFDWFVNLEKWLQIVLIVIMAILLFFVLSILVSVIFALIFKKRLKNDSNAINLLLLERYEIMKDFIKIAENHNISIPKSETKLIENLERIDDFQKLKKEERDSKMMNYLQGSHRIISICEHTSEIVNDEIYADKLIEYNDTEEFYRQKSAQYNADIAGYNYWISIFYIKFVFRIFRIKKKDLII